tara:strand:+ start:10843 stop:11274 length:432 start_codon:yes stop_codon:yes gene_type:complete
VAKKESLFWKKVKTNLKSFRLIRIESWVNLGIPDVLGVSPAGVYFTAELKVTQSNKVSLSPHQIAYHEERANAPAFILAQALRPSTPRKFTMHLYHASQVESLVVHGLKTEPIWTGDQGSWASLEESWTKALRNPISRFFILP